LSYRRPARSRAPSVTYRGRSEHIEVPGCGQGVSRTGADPEDLLLDRALAAALDQLDPAQHAVTRKDRVIPP